MSIHDTKPLPVSILLPLSLSEPVIPVSTNANNCESVNDNSIEPHIINVVVEGESNVDNRDLVVVTKEENHNCHASTENENDIRMKDGWHYFKDNMSEEIYYYYENGMKTKRMEKQSYNEWKEIDLFDNSNYEIGESFKWKLRYGFWRKYRNNTLLEENEYYKGRLCGVKKVFDGMNEMLEYDLNDNLIYRGEYKMDKYKNCNVRNGKGIEYHDGEIYIDGLWRNDVPHGQGKVYIDNGEMYLIGDWDEGELVYEDNIYSYNAGELLYTNNETLLLVLIVACALTIMICGMIMGLFTKATSSVFQITYPVGIITFIVVFLLTSCCKRDGEAYLLFALVGSIGLLISCYFLYGFNDDAFHSSFFVQFYFYVYMIVMLLEVIALWRLMVLVGYRQPNSCNCTLFCFVVNVKGWFFIVINIFVGIASIIHSHLQLWSYKGYFQLSDQIVGVLMIFNSTMCFAVSYLLCYKEELFKCGVWLGCMWGCFSCIVSIILYSTFLYYFGTCGKYDSFCILSQYNILYSIIPVIDCLFVLMLRKVNNKKKSKQDSS